MSLKLDGRYLNLKRDEVGITLHYNKVSMLRYQKPTTNKQAIDWMMMRQTAM